MNAPVKPPRLWLAFLLNLLLPPTGYIYIGAVKAALAAALLFILLAAGATAWTFAYPPGVYADPLGLGMASGAVLLALVLNLAVAMHATALARRPRPRLSASRAWALAFALLLVLHGATLLLKFLGPYSVYEAVAASNEPALIQGDVFLVRGGRALCDVNVRPGDVIVYRRGDERWVKRAIAVGGATVEMRQGRLIIDGRAAPTVDTGRMYAGSARNPSIKSRLLRETLPNGTQYLVLDSGGSLLDEFGPLHLPPGTVFVLGDNRDNSIDSRVDGPIDEAAVCGRVVKVLQAVDPARIGTRP